MKKIKYPDYANSTVSLANSILKYFGAPVHHETLGLLDRKFAEREYENVVVILLDGMGKCIVDGNLEPDFLLPIWRGLTRRCFRRLRWRPQLRSAAGFIRWSIVGWAGIATIRRSIRR